MVIIAELENTVKISKKLWILLKNIRKGNKSMTQMIKSIISRLGILMAILILTMPMSVNAQINIRDGAADGDLLSLMEAYETTSDTEILYLILELADAGGFSADVEQQARIYAQNKLNPSSAGTVTEPTAMPTVEPTIESTEEPIAAPTIEPIASPNPKETPDPTTEEPTVKPTIAPTPKVTATPIATPTTKPVESPVPVIEQIDTSTHSGLIPVVVIIGVVVAATVRGIIIHKLKGKR